ncbi:ribosomal large subunit pseudouridine synthase D [Mycoplasmopsis canis UFG4]|uniref:Pseudouridine synthase n=1 Tax=Mycoplasmopsis canis UFG4 TaxID=1131455 RepID=I1A4I8_9BACT|nr:RluA family pseudouridine synthase [Mycoplasmopsis canis]AKF41393.1 pseudouridine synthase [Mycoplasmopsis canis]EIE39317.1 ribosomal large subunit pseudouridine synthase D [Mycoplasmopsis canis UF33]EIE41259.1 ribosomal large subunit pseudouridine synthase D [Mycoplasmopsis canis UFG1]EIE41409.1 ribosomal large subunit pseudouridine synthase D [Mycoplasmopsis canis UFG4]WQQ12093.1 RluA family pseudouridine synthase [Mycoplasmopsis canis]
MVELIVKYKDRIDKYISNNSEISRNDIKALIEEGAVYVDQMQVNKPKFEVRENQVIKIVKLIDKELKIEPEKMDLNIVYDDEFICIIDKPSGLVVHPSPGHSSGTLVNGLLYHFKNNLSNENGLLRPGIVHRIDKDTSGLLVIAKNNEVHNLLAQKFAEHDINRKYIAICDGILEDKKMRLKLPIGRNSQDRQKMAVTNLNSKEAITNVTLLKSFYINNQPKSLIKCELETGRTHQIRVHMQYIGNPIYGDPMYNKNIDEFGQRLHAYKLEFEHPITKKQMEFYSMPSKEFEVADFDFKEFLKGE